MHPSAIDMPPPRRKRGIPGNGAASRHREIHQGARPATNPGAMTRKTAEPMIASTFLMLSSCGQVARGAYLTDLGISAGQADQPLPSGRGSVARVACWQ